jgi:hypothetical protein
MPRTEPVRSRIGLAVTTRPERRTLVRYGDCIAEIPREARGKCVTIRSLHGDGSERRSTEKWRNLKLLDDQLFQRDPAVIKPSSLPPPSSSQAENPSSALLIHRVLECFAGGELDGL